jgi:hypothetical protein
MVDNVEDDDEERPRTRRNGGGGGGPPLPIITTNNQPQTSTSEIASGISRWLEASSPFLYVELASCVLLIACVSDWYPSTWYKYALSVSLVSLIMCLILQTTEFVVPGFVDWKVGKSEQGYTVQQWCSVFLLFWWIIGTGIITFKGECSMVSYCMHCVGCCVSLKIEYEWIIPLISSF